MTGTETSETSLLQVLLQQLKKTRGERAAVSIEEGMSVVTPGSSSDRAPEAEEPLFLHLHTPGRQQSPPAHKQGGSTVRACIDKLI